mmetsp:Transcript_9026/g.23109  ORF Transcript_9026/g.23109 Transcript_9026/m.23109 type:complete len:180 (-) Transcript_9026:140-679(-)
MSGGGAEGSGAQEAGGSGEAECRICMMTDETTNLVEPCACKGSARYAHHTCIQKWILTDRSCTGRQPARLEPPGRQCEVCGQPWQGDFELPAPRPRRSPEQELELIKLAIASAWLRVQTNMPRPQDEALLTRVAPLVSGPWDEWVAEYLQKRIRQERWRGRKEAVKSFFTGGAPRGRGP